jgi:hypothetical protein
MTPTWQMGSYRSKKTTAYKTIAWNAVGAFYNSWRAWMSWTNAGMEEVHTVHEAYQRFNAA